MAVHTAETLVLVERLVEVERVDLVESKAKFK